MLIPTFSDSKYAYFVQGRVYCNRVYTLLGSCGMYKGVKDRKAKGDDKKSIIFAFLRVEAIVSRLFKSKSRCLGCFKHIC